MTFSRFAAEPAAKAPKDLKRWLTEGLQARSFAPIDRKTSEDRAFGYVELEDHDAVEFGAPALFHGEWALFAFRSDEIRVSGAALRSELDKWAAAFEREQGRAPKRNERAKQRDAIRQVLRSKAEPRSRVVDVAWNLESGQVQVWTTTRKLVEAVSDLMEKSFSVTLRERVPVALAEAMGGSDALRPTPELAWPGAGEGVARE